MQEFSKTYSCFLRERGGYILTVDDVDWYEYQGFMIPAYLPHCCPPITAEMARKVVRISGRPFARWDTEFGRKEPSAWWYVLKKGEWNIESVSDKKKRWMIRQGQKNFTVRQLMMDDILERCPAVAQKAASRYKGDFETETKETLEKQIAAVEKISGVLEYMGCFYGDTLVSFSENYIQDNAVFLANIRHDPEFLNKYSSYGLINGLLEYYLNKKQFQYVLDGCRSIYHKTQFQDHLIKVFGFTKEYANLHRSYSRLFAICVRFVYPSRKLIWKLSTKSDNSILNKMGAVLTQEYIARSCKNQENNNYE